VGASALKAPLFRNGDLKVNAGTSIRSLSLLNWPPGRLARVSLMPSTPATIWDTGSANAPGFTTSGTATTASTPVSLVAELTTTPEKRADQAARLVWLIESRPRVALGCKAVVNRSSRRQSFVG